MDAMGTATTQDHEVPHEAEEVGWHSWEASETQSW